MDTQTTRQRILDTIAASPKPLTAREVIAATDIGSSGVYIELFKLCAKGLLRKRKRPHEGLSRAAFEYYSTPPVDDRPDLSAYKNEIPDHVWWEEQARFGFKPATKRRKTVMNDCDNRV